MKPDWFPAWDRCIIVASGPSAQTTAPWARVHGWPIIAINTSYKLVPFADMLYGCDAEWWRLHDGAPGFAGLKVSQDRAACERFADVKRVHLRGHEFILEPCGQIGGGGNSGFQAINLAVQFGCKTIALIGFDMHRRNGTHWHGDHPMPLSNPEEHAFGKMMEKFNAAAPALLAAGVDVVNCSPDSALKCFRTAKLIEVIGGGA